MKMNSKVFFLLILSLILFSFFECSNNINPFATKKGSNPNDNIGKGISMYSASQTEVDRSEIIIRTKTIPLSGYQTYINNLMNQLSDNYIDRVSLAFKDDETGKFYVYLDDVRSQGYYIDDSYASYDSVITYFIQQAHQKGIKVYAWIPTFNDPSLAQHSHNLAMRIRQENGTVVRSSTWVSPFNQRVMNRAKAIWQDILGRSDMPVDGVRIDHIRFNDDWADWSSIAETRLLNDYGYDLGDVAWGNPDAWDAWVDMRADVIQEDLQELVNTIRNVNSGLDVGVYLLPFSVYDSTMLYYGWTESGQDFEKIGQVSGLNKIFVMAYWDDFCDSSSSYPPYRHIKKWEDNIINNAHSALSGSSVDLIPTFSVTYWAQAFNGGNGSSLSTYKFKKYDDGGRISAINHGDRYISYFYYDKWTSAEAGLASTYRP